MTTPYSALETHLFVDGSAQTAADFAIALNGSVPFTVAAWVRVDSIQDPADILFKDGVFRFGVLGRQVYVEINGFPGLWSDGITHPVTQGEWHYLVCCFTGNQLQLYVDGELDSQAGVSGTGSGNANPFVIGHNLQGSLGRVSVYDSALPSGLILDAMFQPDPAQSYVANFDFSINPPADTSGNQLPLTLSPRDAHVRRVAASAILQSSAYGQPIDDSAVNPGGVANQAYTIQAWVWLSNPTATLTADGLVPAAQAIFVNQEVGGDRAVALYLSYDTQAQAYRLAALAGVPGSTTNTLLSERTIDYGRWVNVAVVYSPSGNQTQLYIDAQADAGSGSIGTLSFADNDILIGGAHLPGQPAMGWTLQGYVQTVDVWNIALSATQIDRFRSDYPVLEPGLAAHYDFTCHLPRNELNGNPIGLADRAAMSAQVAPAIPNETVLARAEPEAEDRGPAQFPPEVMAGFRAQVSFADAPQLDGLLAAAMERELGDDLYFLLPPELVPAARERLSAEWTRVRTLIRTDPLALRFVLSYHKHEGEHVLVHHTPHRSTVVFRAALDTLDDCTMWRIRVIWTILSGLLSVFGVTASLTNKALQFIQQRILGNAALMRAIGNIPPGLTAAGLFVIIRALYDFGVLWPLIKIALTTMGWWALTKLLVKILVKFFGAAIAIAETIASLIVAVAQLIYVLTQQPSNCPLIPSSETAEA